MKRIIIIFLVLFSNFIFTKINLQAYENDIELEATYNYMTEESFNDDFVQISNVPISNSAHGDIVSYFYNLYAYSPINSVGSCGYVSFIQYLCYYDSFINDSIIPEQYEYNQGSVQNFSCITDSPGVIRQNYPKDNLYEFVQNNKNFDFQMRCMDIVNTHYGLTAENYSEKTGMWNYNIILDEINNLDISYSYTSYRNFSNMTPLDDFVIDYFDNYVKEVLDDGHPVMLHIAKYSKDENNQEHFNQYHSVVAYYYDDEGIHCNFGWNEDGTDIILDSDYQIIQAGTIDYNNLTSKHSNNYIINNVAHCGCGHSHNYSVLHHSSLYHQYYCSCGETYLENHNYVPVFSGGIVGPYALVKPLYYVCTVCGYESLTL